MNFWYSTESGFSENHMYYEEIHNGQVCQILHHLKRCVGGRWDEAQISLLSLVTMQRNHRLTYLRPENMISFQ